jgi:hypothetical protein
MGALAPVYNNATEAKMNKIILLLSRIKEKYLSKIK